MAFSTGPDGSISLNCFTPEMWCAANDPGTVPFALAPECDGETRTITITCIPVPAFWFDSNGKVEDGCERSYGTAAADLLLPLDRTIDMPVTCGSSPAVNCPGGVPQDPPATIHWITSPTTLQVIYRTGQSRFDLSADVFLQSEQIPVTVPLVGDCLMEIDTTPGARPDITIQTSLNITTEAQTGEYLLQLGDPTINGLSEDDVELTGGFACQIASVGLGFFLGTLVDSLEETLFQPICTAPEPDLVVYCEP